MTNTERETTKVTTPVDKVEVTLKAWLNAGEKMDMLKVEQKDGIDFMLKTIIVSPDIEAIKALHGKDFDFLLTKMNKVAEDSTWSEKKN